MGIDLVWGSERRENACSREGRAPVDAASDCNSRSSGDTSCSLDDDCPIFLIAESFFSVLQLMIEDDDDSSTRYC